MLSTITTRQIGGSHGDTSVIYDAENPARIPPERAWDRIGLVLGKSNAEQITPIPPYSRPPSSVFPGGPTDGEILHATVDSAGGKPASCPPPSSSRLYTMRSKSEVCLVM